MDEGSHEDAHMSLMLASILQNVHQIIEFHDENREEEARKDVQDFLVDLVHKVEEAVGNIDTKEEVPGILGDIANQIEDIIDQHEAQPGEDGHEKVQDSLLDVVQKVQGAIDTQNEQEEHEGEVDETVPKILENIVQQVEDIIDQHEIQPGEDGHDVVQESLGMVIDQVHDVIDVHDKRDPEELDPEAGEEVSDMLEEIVQQVEDILDHHDAQPGKDGHGRSSETAKAHRG
eukprot:TRINITY_DN1475_c0_g1_i1.p1 TRINITY_DN1475_c0_g1~~TRINITY_DN1475_c0_g1_i1.p1  ORF type:complete len:231 (-),score=62.39 TRINITY_DN1475_c0_g1_i1:2-694(-)